MIRSPQWSIPAFLLAALLVASLPGPVRADETGKAKPDADAARLAEDVVGKAGGDDLGEWSRSILERALKQAGEAARRTMPGSAPGEGTGSPGRSADPLTAELGGPRSGTAEVLIFTSLSVPAASWRQWASEAAKTGAPLVLRGVGEGGLPETAKRIGERLGGHKAGIAIDPRLFRLFDVTRVPAVVVVPNGVASCRSRGCAEDPAPPHDLVTGNIGLAAALETVAEEGDAGRHTARRHLQRLRGEDRP